MTENDPHPILGTGLPDWHRPVWICLAGEQPLPNVLPVLAYRPERVIFLHTELALSATPARRCAAFLKAHGIAAETVPTDAYDIPRICADIIRLAGKYGLDRVLLNYTGGTKPMSIAAYMSLPGFVPKVYYDTRRDGLMVNEGPFEPLRPSDTPLGLEDYLVLNADVRIALDAPTPQAAPATSTVLGEAIESDGRIVFDLLHYRERILKKLKEGRRWKTLSQAIAVPFEDKFPEVSRKLAEAMFDDGLLVEKVDGFAPTVSGLDFLEGFWWEAYVYGRVEQGLRELGVLDTACLSRNVTVQWPGRKTTNELDIAFLMKGRLCIISCTSASLAESEKRRIQVESFAERFGGHFARAILATTLGDADRSTLADRRHFSTLLPRFGDWRDPVRVLKVLG